MGWPKGKTKPKPPGSGRAPGTPNKLTASMREMHLEAFERLGGVDWLVAKAEEDPATFLRGIQRLIPSEVAAKIESSHVIRVQNLSGITDAALDAEESSSLDTDD